MVQWVENSVYTYKKEKGNTRSRCNVVTFDQPGLPSNQGCNLKYIAKVRVAIWRVRIRAAISLGLGLQSTVRVGCNLRLGWAAIYG